MPNLTFNVYHDCSSVSSTFNYSRHAFKFHFFVFIVANAPPPHLSTFTAQPVDERNGGGRGGKEGVGWLGSAALKVTSRQAPGQSQRSVVVRNKAANYRRKGRLISQLSDANVGKLIDSIKLISTRHDVLTADCIFR